MQKIAFLIFSLLYFPFSVLSVPKPDPDNLFIHLHSNKSTAGEVRIGRISSLDHSVLQLPYTFCLWQFSSMAIFYSPFCHQVGLDIHPAQLEGQSISPKSAAGNRILQKCIGTF